MKRGKEEARIAVAAERLKTMKAAGITKAKLARTAGVTWQMAYLWSRALRTSAKLQRAFERLTDGKSVV